MPGLYIPCPRFLHTSFLYYQLKHNLVLCIMLRFGLRVCFLLLLCGEIASSSGTIPICLTNCVQCKQMYGRYFQGRICGDNCITTNGKVMPDCNNPRTLGNYLKRFF